jgi:NAD-dependent deacetylase
MSDTIDLSEYGRVVFFTGAGISAASGVPTYRGAGGVWKEYDYQRYACQTAFESDPERVWEFHNFRRQLVGACEPNGGHHAIAELERKHPHVVVLTQNIDGLHQLAGSERVHEVHGCLWRVRCDACGVVHEGRENPFSELQHACGSYWRPDITWFGDPMNVEVFERCVEEAAQADLLVSIGTSAVVYPAAQLPMIAKERGARLIEINPEETGLSGIYDVTLRGTASDMLQRFKA